MREFKAVGSEILVSGHGRSITEHKQRETDVPVCISAALAHHAALRMNRCPHEKVELMCDVSYVVDVVVYGKTKG